jgi:hypothetical protein
VADNVEVNLAVGTAIMATDEIAAVHFERVKITQGADGANDGDVSSSNPLHTRESGSASAVLANVNDSAASVQLLAANAARRGALFFNDSAEVLYLKFGTTASATDFTLKLMAGQSWSLPAPLYTGRIDGIWDADSAGACRITEW